jgi:hypothetical protein
MAQEFYGVNVGDNDSDGFVTVGTTDTGKDIQIVVVTGVGNTRLDVKRYAERLIRYIVDEDAATVLVQ